MKWLASRSSVPAISTLLERERVLAWAQSDQGAILAGTRDALHLAPGGEFKPRRVPWPQVAAATWDAETSAFRVREVGGGANAGAEHDFALDDARLLLELVRERVTASIVVQRRFQVPGGGLLVVARRPPHGHHAVSWVFEYDESVDPEDAAVRAAAQRALEMTKTDVGLD